MADESPKDEVLWESALEDHPEYVHAIGMISIENANLENMLSDLFSSIVGVSPRIGYSIYLTPKSAIARIEIFENATRAAFAPKKRGGGDDEHKAQLKRARDRALRIAARARTVIGKRHGIIHDSWGVDEGRVIRYISGSSRLDSKPVTLPELKNLVREFRRLILDADDLRAEFNKKPPYLIDMRLN